MRQPSAGIDYGEMIVVIVYVYVLNSHFHNRFKMVHAICKRRKTVGGGTVFDEGGTRSTTGSKLKLDNIAWINFQ
ncbi:hypothetical protein Ddye_023192 [Dipteronia dyeriana]|uniref:Uncharacterized protein n=1 Tax=Dipteronia dyeriana TaxID=168575 RepID=A0AAD9WRX0_9ROSI|nr:hypothetical protein Ddye_023192 [Dipteronia dyeriana]